VLEMNLVETDLQLFGQEHGHGGVGSLSHFDFVHDQRDAPIAVDANEGIGEEGAGRSLRRGQRKSKADEQPAAGGGARLQEGATGQSAHDDRN